MVGADATQPYRDGDPSVVRLSWHFYTTGISWYEAKAQIVREAVRAYRAFPLVQANTNCVTPIPLQKLINFRILALISRRHRLTAANG